MKQSKIACMFTTTVSKSIKFIIIGWLVEKGVVDKYQHTIGQILQTEAIVYILFPYEGIM